jgi:hypothetical protein
MIKKLSRYFFIVLAIIISIILILFIFKNFLITEISYCSDVCPEQTRSIKVYKFIKSPNFCYVIGGQNIYDAAWGGYIGCGPRNFNEPSKTQK